MSGTDIVLTFLGTGAAIPPAGRTQVSCVFRHQNGLVIFDCGEGTQYLMRKYKISTRKEILICISHLHSDHFLGLPGLLSSFELLDRKDPIIILGPRGVQDLVKNLIEANFVGHTYEIRIVELDGEDRIQTKNYELESVPALHFGNALSFIWKENERPGKLDEEKLKDLGIPKGPLYGKLQRGLTIEYQGKVVKPHEVLGKPRRGRVIAYSGDSRPNPAFIEHLTGETDILIHEATYPSNLDEIAKERKHSTTTEVAKLVQNSNINRLILTHISPRILNISRELKLVQKIFSNSIVAEEGLEIIIPWIK